MYFRFPFPGDGKTGDGALLHRAEGGGGFDSARATEGGKTGDGALHGAEGGGSARATKEVSEGVCFSHGLPLSLAISQSSKSVMHM